MVAPADKGISASLVLSGTIRLMLLTILCLVRLSPGPCGCVADWPKATEGFYLYQG